MEKTPFVIYDLKTDRSGISGGLPSIYRLVPVAFYICAAGAVALNLIYFLSFKSHKTSEERWIQAAQQAQFSQTQVIQKQKALMDQARQAEDIADWLEGARPVQPINVSISRSMGVDSTIAQLDLTRNPEIPGHLFMALKLNGTDHRQLETTLDSITNLNYQTYSAHQTKGDDAVDFNATLIWNSLNK